MTVPNGHMNAYGSQKVPSIGDGLLDRSAVTREHQGPISPVRKIAVTYLTINTHLEQPRRLSVTGEVDFASANELRDALAPLSNEKTDVILDFEYVTFLDSSGISVLVTISAALSPGRLIVHGAQPGVRMTLDVVGLGAFCD